MKKALNEIKNFEIIIADLLQSLQQYIYALDKDGKIIYIHSSFLDLIELNEKDIIGKPFSEIVIQNDKAMVETMFDSSVKTTSIKPGSIKDHNGNILPFFIAIQKIEGSNEIGYVGLLLNSNMLINNLCDEDNSELIQVLEQSAASIVITDPDGVAEYVNSSFSKISGYELDVVIDEHINLLKNGLMSEDVFQSIMDQIENGDEWIGELRYQKKDGTYYWESASIGAIKDIEGNIAHLVKVAENITDQKNLLSMLLRSYEFIEGIMNNINSMFIINSKFKVIQINKQFTEEFGYQTVDIVGKQIIEYIHEKSINIFERNIETIIKKKNERKEFEFEIKKKDSNYSLVCFKCAPFIVEEDKMYIVGTLEDITERHQMELRLEKLSKAVEHSPASVVITDINGIIEYVNPKFTNLTGYTFEEVIGHNPRVLKSGVQSDEFYKEMWETIISGAEWRGEFHNRKKNNKLYWEFASISPMKNNKGDVTHFIAVKEDVTERKLAEEALRISEENLRKKNNLLKKELEYAQLIIKMLLPDKPPVYDRLKIDFRYMPLEEVGGDFFTFFPSNENNNLGVFIADVAGHGVSAALFLSLVKSVAERLFKKFPYKVTDYLKGLNRELSDNMTNYFLTAVYGFFKEDEKGFTFSFGKAGHPPPLLYVDKDKEVVILKAKGSLIGFLNELEFEEVNIKLHKGDRIYLFTDGIIETTNKNKVMLQHEGLKEIIENNYNVPLAEQLDKVIEEVNLYREETPEEDDIIIIGFEVL